MFAATRGGAWREAAQPQREATTARAVAAWRVAALDQPSIAPGSRRMAISLGPLPNHYQAPLVLVLVMVLVGMGMAGGGDIAFLC